MLEGTDLMSAYQTLSNQPVAYEYPTEEAPQQQPLPKQKDEKYDPKYDMNLYNKQFETDQKIQALVTELKKRKANGQTQSQSQEPEQQSYFDKLFGKKKELYKVLQLSLMITFGISVHFLIDHYLTQYLADHEMSFERQLFLRILYPVSVLFILWNLRVFVK
jgi:hypothetical protein